MIFKIKQKGKVIILKALVKRLEADIAEEIKKELSELVNKKTKIMVIDISDVDFIDSSGLGAIIFTYKLLKGKGRIAIAGAKEGVKSILQLTRMDRLFQIFENTKEAVNILSV
ncbi:Anti-sigma-B factor antagonist [Desulfonema limicola]|uniref:Anti-sigma factor antagonist n=1 Tax=Desulfonema limicola TaxID=45656 RepID=A0A975B5N9_9BACT|nr:STAS domain-containing protein [Desulfonema limicola]QTA79255.1 Anti-sigma-B factor antagonist [Desulfonema limicola]